MRGGKIQHGHALSSGKTPTYKSWEAMIRRCANPKVERYSNYGGRGIIVCEKWKISFAEFIKDMGVKPKGLTLERIDVNGNYEPNNCRWATKKEQANNRVNTVRYEIAGKQYTLAELSELSGICYGTLRTRIFTLKWSVEKSINRPPSHLRS